MNLPVLFLWFRPSSCRWPCSLPTAIACTKLVRMDLTHKTGRVDRLYVFWDDNMANSLKIVTGFLSPPVANIFGRKPLGFVDSSDWRVLVAFSMNSTYSMLFLSSPKEESLTVMLWCSWWPQRPKYWARSHQNVWTRICRLPFPSFIFSHSSFSLVVVRLVALFGRLPLPCCCKSLAFPSRTWFELINSLSQMTKTFVFSLCGIGRYQQPSHGGYQVCNCNCSSYELLHKTAWGFCSGSLVCTFQYFSHNPFEQPKTFRLLSSYLCFVRCFCS